MAKSKADQPDNSDKKLKGTGSETSGPDENLRADAIEKPVQDPLNLLLQLATDDNVEDSEGQEFLVDNVRTSTENTLLTKSEMQKYDDYKREWAATLAKPQESLEMLAQREKQIIEAAQNHDWEALDRLKKEVDADLERMRFIYSNIGSDLTNL